MLDHAHNSTRVEMRRRLNAGPLLVAFQRVGQVMGFVYRAVATLFRGTTGASKVFSLTHTGFQASQMVCKVAAYLPKVGPAFKAVYNLAKPLVKLLKKAKDALFKW